VAARVAFMPTQALAEKSLDSFAAMTDQLAGQRQSLSPHALIGPIEAHRDAASALFRAATDERAKHRAGALLAETSIVASRVWSAIGDRPMALTHSAFARKLAEMSVAGSEFRPRITNANDGSSVKFVGRNSLVFHPGPVNKTIFSCFAEPVLASVFLFHVNVLDWGKRI